MSRRSGASADAQASPRKAHAPPPALEVRVARHALAHSAILLVTLVGCAGEAWAQGRASKASPCDERHGTAVGQLACEVARQLGAAEGPVTVYVSSLHAPSGLKRANELATLVASRVATELGPGARSIAGLSSETTPSKTGPLSKPAPSAQTEQRDADSTRRVLSLRLEVGERVALDAELSRGVRRFWDRFRASAPGVIAAAHASRPLDAEIRSFFPPVPLVVQRIDKLLPADEPSVALACGDLDGDGSIELVSVGRARIKIGRFRAGRYVVEKQASWAQLSGVAAHPLRDPISSAQILEGHGLLVGLSDRAEGLLLDEQLTVSARFPNRAPWPPEACTQRSGLGFLTTPQDCSAARASAATGSSSLRKEKPPAPSPDADPFAAIDSFAGLRVVRGDGTQLVIRARRDLSGRVALQVNERELESRWPAGASLALGDLNGDGRAELLSSENTLDATQDALSVRTLTAGDDLETVLRLPVASGIHAIAVCPSAPLNFAPVVLATGDGFWVLR